MVWVFNVNNLTLMWARTRAYVRARARVFVYECMSARAFMRDIVLI